MALDLPPLNSLKSFEAAARHLSFSKAGDELHVTHGAVSRAIARLEDYLGVKLFQRAVRSVSLTPTGRRYAEEVRGVLQDLAQATANTVERCSSGVLNFSTLDSFAARWVLPRLSRFRAQHPNIDLRISTSVEQANFTTDGIDIAVRYGLGKYPGLVTELLMQEAVFPVCSPELLKGGVSLDCATELKHYTLIHHDFHKDFMVSWEDWLRVCLEDCQVDTIDHTRGPVYESSSLGVQAAVQGEGILLGRGALVEDDLKAGRLVRPFKTALIAPFCYYVVCPKGGLDQPNVKAFRDWMFEEVARDQRDELAA